MACYGGAQPAGDVPGLHRGRCIPRVRWASTFCCLCVYESPFIIFCIPVFQKYMETLHISCQVGVLLPTCLRVAMYPDLCGAEPFASLPYSCLCGGPLGVREGWRLCIEQIWRGMPLIELRFVQPAMQ